MTRCNECKKTAVNCSCYLCGTCKKNSSACLCDDTCKVCLTAGRLEDDGSCTCCPKCRNSACICTLDRSKKPQNPSSSSHAPKPPDISLLKDKNNLSIYVASLRRWSRIGGVEPELQADVVLMHAPQQFPELYMELEAELGESILDNKNGIDLIIKSLETRFGVNKQADLIKHFNKFTSTVRKHNQDLLSYVNAFDLAYFDLKKMEEELSQTFLALFLLTNANLSDVDFQIITSQLDFNEKESLYSEAKSALRRHQYCKVANSKPQPLQNANQKLSDNHATLLSSVFPDQEISQDLIEGFRSYLSKENDKKKKPPYKCWRCLCKCPRSKACECECTKHPHWKCKKRKERPNESDEDDEDSSNKQPKASKSLYGICQYSTDFQSRLNSDQVFLVKSVVSRPQEKRSGFSNPLTELLAYPCLPNPAAQVQDEVIYLNQDIAYFSRNKNDKLEIHTFILDTGAPYTLMGMAQFKRLYNAYPKSIAVQFDFRSSSRQFIFGAGEKSRSLGVVTIPIYLKDSEDNLHLIKLNVEIVNIDIVMLLGSKSMSKAGAIIDLARSELVLENAVDKKTKFPLVNKDSGHYHLQIFPMTEEEGRHASEIYFMEHKWNENEIEQVLSYVISARMPRIDHIMNEKIYVNTFSRKSLKKKLRNTKSLTRKQIFKLHHVFGHVGADKLEAFIGRAGKLCDKTRKYLEEIKHCDVCKVEGRRIPKPKVSFPKATNHNHLVCINLKENIRCKNDLKYI